MKTLEHLKPFLLYQVILSGQKGNLIASCNGWLTPQPPFLLPNYPFIRTTLLLYQGITLLLMGGFASPTLIYKFTLLSEQSSFNSYSFKQGFPSEQKKRKALKAPLRPQCQSSFNANSAQEISAFQRHPYNHPRRISNAITAYTDGSKRHPRWAINGIKKELSSTTSIAVNKSYRRVGDTPRYRLT